MPHPPLTRPGTPTLAASFTLALGLSLTITHLPAPAADPVYSGPQPGEKTTPFRVLDLRSPGDAPERDPVTEHNGAPTALVFIHTIERSLVPLLRVIDRYGHERKDRLRTELVFLTPDRLSGEQRVRAAAQSLRLANPFSLSPDGPEGPGNYGLDKSCMMTIVLARSNLVTTNFALTQPGIADAPRVVAALAQTCNDPQPPSVADLAGPQGRGMDRPMARRPNSPASASAATATATNLPPQEDPFPGAVPTDDRLQSLLRRFIRATNDTATTDAILADVRAHIGTNPDLRRQAIDGWTRVLHFGDRYGNEHSRKVGQAFLESLHTTTQPAPTAPAR